MRRGDVVYNSCALYINIIVVQTAVASTAIVRE